MQWWIIAILVLAMVAFVTWLEAWLAAWLADAIKEGMDKWSGH